MKQGININLSTIAQGAVQEKVTKAVKEIVTNILDPNTEATKTRSTTIKLTYKPNEQRNTVHAVSRRRYDYLTAPDTITTVTMNDERGLWLVKHRPDLIVWVD